MSRPGIRGLIQRLRYKYASVDIIGVISALAIFQEL